eukprot:311829-Chlamydomonas_euryale.AAC.3
MADIVLHSFSQPFHPPSPPRAQPRVKQQPEEPRHGGGPHSSPLSFTPPVPCRSKDMSISDEINRVMAEIAGAAEAARASSEKRARNDRSIAELEADAAGMVVDEGLLEDAEARVAALTQRLSHKEAELRGRCVRRWLRDGGAWLRMRKRGWRR